MNKLFKLNELRQRYKSMLNKTVNLYVGGEITKGTVIEYFENNSIIELTINHDPIYWSNNIFTSSKRTLNKDTLDGQLLNIHLI